MANVTEQSQSMAEQTPLGQMHHNLSDIIPAASELGCLWECYFAESMAVAFLKVHTSHTDEPEIKPLLQRALDVSTQRVQTLENLFNSINHPIPQGFGEDDVDVNTQPLFSDSYRALYTRLMHRYDLINYTKALTTAYRTDLRNFFSQCLKDSEQIFQQGTDILLGKGILPKAPSIVIPDRLDFVHSKSYFGNFFGSLFGEQRPLNALEIGQIYSLIETDHLIRILKTGYSQVVKSNKVLTFLLKCKAQVEEHINKLSALLEAEDIPVPVISELLVTDSRQSPFSDKLILSHFTATTAFTITAVGLAMPDLTRKDLVLIMGNIVKDLMQIAKEGAELMIEAGWLERIPETADRGKLFH